MIIITILIIDVVVVFVIIITIIVTQAVQANDLGQFLRAPT